MLTAQEQPTLQLTELEKSIQTQVSEYAQRANSEIEILIAANAALQTQNAALHLENETLRAQLAHHVTSDESRPGSHSTSGHQTVRTTDRKSTGYERTHPAETGDLLQQEFPPAEQLPGVAQTDSVQTEDHEQDTSGCHDEVGETAPRTKQHTGHGLLDCFRPSPSRPPKQTKFSDAIEQSKRSVEAEMLHRSQNAAGELLFEDATLKRPEFRLQGASNIGPSDDKGNQDAFAVWVPSKSCHVVAEPRAAVAIADGITGALMAEYGAQLASTVGLTSLLESRKSPDSQNALVKAQEALTSVYNDHFDNDKAPIERKTIPRDMKCYLRKKLVFQSTLSLLWMDRDEMHYCGVGDTGVCIEWVNSNGEIQRDCFRFVDEDCHTDALGPHMPEFGADWIDTGSIPLITDGWELNRVAIYTDQVGRGVNNDANRLFEAIDRFADRANAVQTLLQNFVDERPRDFDDNLTLVVLDRQLNPTQKEF